MTQINVDYSRYLPTVETMRDEPGRWFSSDRARREEERIENLSRQLVIVAAIRRYIRRETTPVTREERHFQALPRI